MPIERLSWSDLRPGTAKHSCAGVGSLATRSSAAIRKGTSASASLESNEEDCNNPDLPRFFRGHIDERELFQLRSEQLAKFRGYVPNERFDVAARGRALRVMAQQQSRIIDLLQKSRLTDQPTAVLSTWTAIGPSPIPNGQTQTTVDAVSGRVTAIDVHPTNALIAYVGTALGGVYRTTDGGTTWANIMAGTPPSSSPPAPPAGFSPGGH